MKALVKAHAEPGLWLQDVPEPEPGLNDVKIRVKRAAICGTDLHIYKWDEWAQKTIPVPMVVGHEFVGEIVEVGGNVRNLAPGTIVSGEGHIVCGRCRNCMAGRRHLCPNTKGVGVNRPGAFAEYVVIPDENVWQHSDGVDLDVASIFDPFGNAVHTALQWDMLGEDVLITGAAVARHAGARHVVITDVNDYRLELAARVGATRTVNVEREKLADVQRELGMTEGFDVGLEMSGNPHAFRDLLDNMASGGKVSLLGIPAGDVAIDWNKVIFKMLTLKGIYGREMYDTWYKMSVMVGSGLDISPIITHRLPFQDYQRGFETMLQGNTGKVVLQWD
jgi:threonine 3-dehydrogenase